MRSGIAVLLEIPFEVVQKAKIISTSLMEIVGEAETVWYLLR
jgi:hypothetical protein